MPSPKAIASASSSPAAAGAFVDGKNNPVAAGYLKIKLALPSNSVASLTGGGEVNSTQTVKITLDNNGIPSPGQTMFMSDQFSSPVNPAFNIEVHTSGDQIVGVIKNAVLTGTAPVDLTNITVTANGPSYSGSVLLTPSGNQTITSGNLTVNAGSVDATDFTVHGTASTGTGGVVRATSPTLTTPTLNSATLASATLTSPTVSNVSGLTPGKQIFTSSGTFTIPSGVKAVKVTVVGAGGAGGGATTTSGSGAGGSGGGWAVKWLTGLTPGNTLAVTVGSGGTGNANATGGSGGNSTVASGTQTISTITGTGGNGGPITGTNAALNGAGTGGDTNGNGLSGQYSTFGNSGGIGGGSFLGGGGSFGISGAGGAGNAPGSGGGGAGGSASGTVAGGGGANGIVIFEWIN